MCATNFRLQKSNCDEKEDVIIMELQKLQDLL